MLLATLVLELRLSSAGCLIYLRAAPRPTPS